MKDRKIGLINLFAGKKWRCKYGLVDAAGEGKSRTNEKSSINIYTLPSVE